jgi:hypothetical protein
MPAFTRRRLRRANPQAWPPPDGAPSVMIAVSLDTWHAMIALPIEKKDGGNKKAYEE